MSAPTPGVDSQTPCQIAVDALVTGLESVAALSALGKTLEPLSAGCFSLTPASLVACPLLLSAVIAELPLLQMARKDLFDAAAAVVPCIQSFISSGPPTGPPPATDPPMPGRTRVWSKDAVAYT